MTELRKPFSSQEGWRQLAWPNGCTPEGAKGAIKLGFFAAVCVSASTSGLALLAELGVGPVQRLGIDGTFFFDGLIYAAIADGIRRHSRTAAWAGLLLFALARALNWYRVGVNGHTLVLAGIFIMAFIGGIRGTTAWHRLKTRQNTVPVADEERLISSL
jgi:hypothetical protein